MPNKVKKRKKASKRKSKQPITYLVSDSGVSFIDLAVDRKEIRILISKPGMKVSELLSTTNLSVVDGLTTFNLACLASKLEVVSYCGFANSVQIPVQVQNPCNPRLKVGVGFPAMYQSELVIRSKTRQTLNQLVRHHLTQKGRRNLVFGLMPMYSDMSLHQTMVSVSPGHIKETLTD